MHFSIDCSLYSLSNGIYIYIYINREKREASDLRTPLAYLCLLLYSFPYDIYKVLQYIYIYGNE